MRMGKAQTVKVRIHRNIDCTEKTTAIGWKTHDFLGQQLITGPETEEKLKDQKKNGQTNYQSPKEPFQPYGHKHEVQRGTANRKVCIPKIYSTPNFELKLHLLCDHITITPPDDSATSTHYSRLHSTRNGWAEDLAIWCSLSLSLSATESVQINSPTAIFKKQHTCVMKIVNRIDVRRLCSYNTQTCIFFEETTRGF